MNGLEHFWIHGDVVIRATALLLLAMSVATWAVIAWKVRLLRAARASVRGATAAFWSARDLDDARDRVAETDRTGQVALLVEAAARPAEDGTLEATGPADAQRTRRLREALHEGLAPLQQGQVLLASIGSTAPFIGLFGTVWGIYHALAGLAGETALSLEAVAGPVGEALLITAAGLVVAVPAVLAYNVFGQQVARCEADLEGFALDLRDSLAGKREPASKPQGAEAVIAAPTGGET
ncbi:MAG: MotA/TolQ/ExbB proton channel family protein [Ideonella sp.]|jgi:biopolymer transport protein ExbB|nr:MotA/TolQ/ExbB proton channel family protein [Ideonella sp.]